MMIGAQGGEHSEPRGGWATPGSAEFKLTVKFAPKAFCPTFSVTSLQIPPGLGGEPNVMNGGNSGSHGSTRVRGA